MFSSLHFSHVNFTSVQCSTFHFFACHFTPINFIRISIKLYLSSDSFLLLRPASTMSSLPSLSLFLAFLHSFIPWREIFLLDLSPAVAFLFAFYALNILLFSFSWESLSGDDSVLGIELLNEGGKRKRTSAIFQHFVGTLRKFSWVNIKLLSHSLHCRNDPFKHYKAMKPILKRY